MSRLASFLQGDGVDDCGRTIADILAWPAAELETRHDFIQWLFPLPEASRAVAGSPILTGEEAAAIHASKAALSNLDAAAKRMLAFYAANDHWLRSHDHNHLRITRIIRSLRLLVGNDAADAFRAGIRALAAEARAPINSTTLRFWDEA